jgi:hypothetical protein
MPQKSKAKAAPKPVRTSLPAPDPDCEIFTRLGAAKFAQINIQNLDEAIKREELKAYRPIGRKVLIFRKDLIAWILGAPMYRKGAQ